MFETWGQRLGITEDENDYACREGFEALRLFDEEMERRGLEMLEQLEEEHKVGVLLLGRPYHLDPGLHHGVPDEYPGARLSGPVHPIDPEGSEVAGALLQGRPRSRLHHDAARQSQDVWPENYSTNSVQKVWAAKFAARHPNVVVLDLSSFKCGHDAPTYGLIDNIINSSGTPCFGAARHRRQQARRLDQDPRQDLRAHAEAFEEELQDAAAKRNELQRRVEEKRRELLAPRAHGCAEQPRWPIRGARESSTSSSAAFALVPG